MEITLDMAHASSKPFFENSFTQYLTCQQTLASVIGEFLKVRQQVTPFSPRLAVKSNDTKSGKSSKISVSSFLKTKLTFREIFVSRHARNGNKKVKFVLFSKRKNPIFHILTCDSQSLSVLSFPYAPGERKKTTLMYA
jgi:hypothetical protein